MLTLTLLAELSGSLQSSFICDQIAKRLRKEYPFYYYKIIEVCRQNKVTLINKVYYSPFFKKNVTALQFFDKYKQSYYDKFLQKENKNHLQFQSNLSPNLVPAAELERTILILTHLKLFPKTSFSKYKIPNCYIKVRYIKYLISKIRGKNTRKKLQEILNLELKKNRLKKLFKKESFISYAYFMDTFKYEKTETLFLKNENEILNNTVYVNPSVILLNLSRKWIFNSSLMELSDKIEEMLHISPSIEKVALIPHALKLLVEEMYLDKLDMTIVNNCKNKIKIKFILAETRSLFKNSDIENSYETYKKLLLDSIKRLIYCGIINVNYN